MFPFATYFPGSTQVIYYYVLVGGSPIAVGATQSGFRFLSSGAGSPYLLFDTGGNVVEQGETQGTTPVGAGTWGAVKALYR